MPDINECKQASTNQCQHTCTNNVGSYSCSCKQGFRLNSNQRACDGKSVNKKMYILTFVRICSASLGLFYLILVAQNVIYGRQFNVI